MRVACVGSSMSTLRISLLTCMEVKMFVLGDPGAGKSTLVKSLQTEGAMFSCFKHRFTKVTDIDERTAGIIPYDIVSKAMGRVTSLVIESSTLVMMLFSGIP